MIGREDGAATLELSLGTAVLVLPMVLLVAMLPLWLERESVTSLAAREAARAFVLAAEPAQAVQQAQDVARRIAQEHGIAAADFTLRVSGALEWGATATVSASVRMPVLTLPVLGAVGGFTITREHREIVDPYRGW